MIGLILVEGRGELVAAHNLVSRITYDLGHSIAWSHPRRWPNLHHLRTRRGGIEGAAEFARSTANTGALLVLSDADEKCPKTLCPQASQFLSSLNLPFPAAYIQFKPEYEVIFLPCLSNMNNLGFSSDVAWDKQSWEARRDIKGWLSAQLPKGRSYKPTTDQLKMTQRVDLSILNNSNLPCFQTLVRAIDCLCNNFGSHGVTYP